MSKKVSVFVSAVLWIGIIINEVWLGVWAIEQGYRTFGIVCIGLALLTASIGGMFYESEWMVKRMEETHEDKRRV